MNIDLIKILGAFICDCKKEQKRKGRSEQHSYWWRKINGYDNRMDNQFKKRFRVNRNTFNYYFTT